MAQWADTLGTSCAYRAGLYEGKVLASSTETVYEVTRGTGSFANRAYPLTTTAVATFFRSDLKSGCHSP